jgi:hypothetical protein
LLEIKTKFQNLGELIYFIALLYCLFFTHFKRHWYQGPPFPLVLISTSTCSSGKTEEQKEHTLEAKSNFDSNFALIPPNGLSFWFLNHFPCRTAALIFCCVLCIIRMQDTHHFLVSQSAENREQKRRVRNGEQSKSTHCC